LLSFAAEDALRPRSAAAALVLLATLVATRPAHAAEPTVPERPAEGVFVSDGARLLNEADAAAVRDICKRALEERGVPIAVATIPSMATYGAQGWTIEAYARRLFDAWGLGSPERNVGILLLVSRDDRRARIELGAEWGAGHHEYAQEVLDRRLLPRFREGRFSEGIHEGTAGLFSLAALGPSQPAPEAPAAPAAPLPWMNLAILGVILLVFIVRTVARARRGANRSWAPGVGPFGGGLGFPRGAYGGPFGGPTYGGGTYGSGGSYGGGGVAGGGGASRGGSSGGSYGGGFSGGGGASGSW
jgi:uncharacterized protein